MMYLFKYVSILLKARFEKLIPPQNSQATAFMTDAYEANSEVRLLSILYQTSQLTPLGLPNKYLTRSRQRQNQNRKASHLTFHLHALSFTLTTTEHPRCLASRHQPRNPNIPIPHHNLLNNHSHFPNIHPLRTPHPNHLLPPHLGLPTPTANQPRSPPLLQTKPHYNHHRKPPHTIPSAARAPQMCPQGRLAGAHSLQH